MSLKDINERFQEALKRNKTFEQNYKGARNTSSYHRQKGSYISQIKGAKEALDKYGKGDIYQVDVQCEALGQAALNMRVLYVNVTEADIEYLIKRDFFNVVKYTSKKIEAGKRYLQKSSK